MPFVAKCRPFAVYAPRLIPHQPPTSDGASATTYPHAPAVGCPKVNATRTVVRSRRADGIQLDASGIELAGFALTTFPLSAHNAGWAPDIIWIWPTLFYDSLA